MNDLLTYSLTYLLTSSVSDFPSEIGAGAQTIGARTSNRFKSRRPFISSRNVVCCKIYLCTAWDMRMLVLKKSQITIHNYIKGWVTVSRNFACVHGSTNKSNGIPMVP